MPVATDIIEAYVAPRRVMARVLDRGAREDRALAYLMAGCFLMFIARLPVLSRQAHLTGEELPSLAAGAFVGGVFMAPLVFYGLAGLSHLVARALGGQGDWLHARMALFWTVLAISPVMLLRGLVEGFIGPGGALNLISIIAGGAFMVLWIGALRVVERFGAGADGRISGQVGK